jgi:hypothetical protein
MNCVDRNALDVDLDLREAVQFFDRRIKVEFVCPIIQKLSKIDRATSVGPIVVEVQLWKSKGPDLITQTVEFRSSPSNFKIHRLLLNR